MRSVWAPVSRRSRQLVFQARPRLTDPCGPIRGPGSWTMARNESAPTGKPRPPRPGKLPLPPGLPSESPDALSRFRPARPRRRDRRGAAPRARQHVPARADHVERPLERRGPRLLRPARGPRGAVPRAVGRARPARRAGARARRGGAGGLHRSPRGAGVRPRRAAGHRAPARLARGRPRSDARRDRCRDRRRARRRRRGEPRAARRAARRARAVPLAAQGRRDRLRPAQGVPWPESRRSA